MNPSLPKIQVSDSQIQQAEQAVSRAQMIAPPTGFEELAKQWSQTSALGLDTEFVRERTFYPRPGLIQVSDGQAIWLLDPVGRDAFPCFGDILDNRNIIKILHSVGEDLEVFRILTGSLPDPLFDTQIAAAMLGMPLQFRYEKLVEHCFSVELPGGQARSDWCRRPLSEGLLRYAAQDVIWLGRLQQLLTETLEQEGRLAWHEEDCARLIRQARADDAGNPVLRVKGAGRLDDGQLAWLARLADWREQQARGRDLPRSFVIRDEAMIDLAERGGKGQELEQALNRLAPPLLRRYGDTLRGLLTGSAPDALERPSELVALDSEQREAVKQAQAAVRQLAEELDVDPALIASKRELTRLVRGETPDWMQGWRGQFLGDLFSKLKG